MRLDYNVPPSYPPARGRVLGSETITFPFGYKL